MQAGLSKAVVDPFYDDFIDLRNYFDCDDFGSSISLGKNSSLSFHWANCSTTCLYERNEAQQKHRGKHRLTRLLNFLERFKDTPVWIRGPIETKKITLFELYDWWTMGQSRQNVNTESQNMLVSLHNQAGPFVPIHSLRWFNPDEYRLFVLKKILTGPMTLRQFRLNTDIPVVGFFHEQDVDSFKLGIHQILPSGILFKAQGASFRIKFSHNDYLNLVIPAHELISCKEIPTPEIKEFFDQIDLSAPRKETRLNVRLSRRILYFYGNHEGLEIEKGGHHFFFAKFEDFENQHEGLSVSIKDIFKPVVNKYQEFLLSSLKLAA